MGKVAVSLWGRNAGTVKQGNNIRRDTGHGRTHANRAAAFSSSVQRSSSPPMKNPGSVVEPIMPLSLRSSHCCVDCLVGVKIHALSVVMVGRERGHTVE